MSASSLTYANLNSKIKLNPVSRSKLRIVHSSITVATVGICAVHLFIFNGLLGLGNLWTSPTIPLLITAEVIKWLVNEKYLKLKAHPKHIINAYQRREPDMIDWLKDIFHIITTIFVFFCAYIFTCIVFGAAIVQQFHGTICLSIVLVTFTVLPLCLYLGGTGTWQLLFCDQFELTSKSQVAYLEYVQFNAMATLFGAWISSVVAPLDWDRDWQNYPIPNMCGAMFGVVVANIYCLIIGVGKHIGKKRHEIKRRKAT